MYHLHLIGVTVDEINIRFLCARCKTLQQTLQPVLERTHEHIHSHTHTWRVA